MKRDSKQIIAQLNQEGLSFKAFSLNHEGEYHPDDADWNYKDVPHLHHIHELVEAVPALVEDHIISSINMQKVFFLHLPLCVVNYEHSRHRQVYFTTLLFFALVIETSFESVSESRTRVTTTYNIGAKAWLLYISFPLIKWLLKRNYDNLMSGDIPMRLRKGQLRAWGYTFSKSGDTYSFKDTMNTMKPNLTLPVSIPKPKAISVNINTDLIDGQQILWGRADHNGLRIHRSGDDLRFMPRICPHEGASLDESNCDDGKAKCPWHGRAFKPIAIIRISSGDQKIETERQTIYLISGTLTVEMK